MCVCENECQRHVHVLVWGAPWGSLENAERRIELSLCVAVSLIVTSRVTLYAWPNKDNLIVFTVIVIVVAAQLYVVATKKMQVVRLGYRQIA